MSRSAAKDDSSNDIKKKKKKAAKDDSSNDIKKKKKKAAKDDSSNDIKKKKEKNKSKGINKITKSSSWIWFTSSYKCIRK